MEVIIKIRMNHWLKIFVRNYTFWVVLLSYLLLIFLPFTCFHLTLAPYSLPFAILLFSSILSLILYLTLFAMLIIVLTLLVKKLCLSFHLRCLFLHNYSILLSLCSLFQKLKILFPSVNFHVFYCFSLISTSFVLIHDSYFILALGALNLLFIWCFLGIYLFFITIALFNSCSIHNY